MRANIFFIIACLLAIAAGQTYQLVWSDEFNGNSLDLSKWTIEQNCDGGGNNELQCYTNQPQNIAVRNGSLVITAIPQNYNGRVTHLEESTHKPAPPSSMDVLFSAPSSPTVSTSGPPFG